MTPETVKCPACGASVPPTGACRFCGATAFIEGVAGRLLPSDLKCPRCTDGPDLRGVEHEGRRADLCMKCHGVWFGPGLLEEALRAASLRPPLPGEAAGGPAHGGIEPVRYARCPACGGGMSRVPFARKPLVIIDRCPAHGDWCDGGEMGQLIVVARSRGMEDIGIPKEAKQGPRGASPADRDSPLGGKRFPSGGLFTEEVMEESRAREGRGRGQGPLYTLIDVIWSLIIR